MVYLVPAVFEESVRYTECATTSEVTCLKVGLWMRECPTALAKGLGLGSFLHFPKIWG